MAVARCDWDPRKDRANRTKHGVSFAEVQVAFADPPRLLAEDASHRAAEKRFYCFGRVRGGVMTVRFTDRGGVIRIFWRGLPAERKAAL